MWKNMVRYIVVSRFILHQIWRIVKTISINKILDQRYLKKKRLINISNWNLIQEKKIGKKRKKHRSSYYWNN